MLLPRRTRGVADGAVKIARRGILDLHGFRATPQAFIRRTSVRDLIGRFGRRYPAHPVLDVIPHRLGVTVQA